MARQKHRETPLPDIITGVTVAQLEEIALRSQQGKKREGGCRTYLADFERSLGDIRLKIDEVKKAFQGETILCAAVDCDKGHAVAELNGVEGVEAFGTGGGFQHIENTGLPLDRYIVSDSPGLPGIPDNSFHMVIHVGALETPEDLKKQVSAMYRVTRPGGVAVMEIEDRKMFIDVVGQLGLTEQVDAVDTKSYERTGLIEFSDFFNQISIKDYNTSWQRFYRTHFEILKPR